MASVVVTGANGFIGSSLIKTLHSDRNFYVTGTSRVGPDSSELALNIVHSPDFNNESAWTAILAGHDVLVHCAARVHKTNEHSLDPLADFRSVNTFGTSLIAKHAAAAGIRRFVFISSIKVNGEGTPSGHPYTSNDVANPKDPYGISKMEAEQLLLELSAQTGMEVVIIRPPLVYGPGVKANFASMMNWLKRGVPLPLGGITSNRRSLVYVENLVDLISVCVDHPNATNQIFLVSDDDDVSTTSLLRRMAKALGCPARLISLSPRLIKLAAKCIGKSGISDRLCGSLQVDITKTKELLGWKPKFSLDEGLRRTVMPTVSSLYK